VPSRSEPDTVAQRPPLALLLAVALVSAAVLGFEVALTRVFGVLLRYHFAFLVISIALCGLGLGGYAAHWWRRTRQVSLPFLAVLFALAIDATLLLMLRGVFAHAPGAYWVAALVVLLPFALAGAFLAEAFARFPDWSGRLYAWDLMGAALAAIVVVGLLQWMSAIDACLALAVLASLAGPFLLSHQAHRTRSRHSVVLTPALLLILLAANVRFRWLDIPPLPPQFDEQRMSLADQGVTQPLFTELGTPGHESRVLETRWNAFARTDVVIDPASPGSYLLYTNGNVPTNMMQWDGQVRSIPSVTNDFVLNDWVFADAPLGGRQDQKNARRGDVLSIGPGGGLDALLAVRYGARQFDGAEINPSIVDIMRAYRAYNGAIYERPEVRVVTAEGRAFVREAVIGGRRYALLFSALTKTATAGSGMALLESYIYTTDAFADYLNALEDDGQMAIVGDNPLLLARFFATAVEVLGRGGMDERTACRHIALVYNQRPGPYQCALVVQKSPFSRAQTDTMLTGALQRGLTAIWIPDQAARSDFGPYPAVAAGKMSLDDFINWFLNPRNLELFNIAQPLDIAPRPDNRPFVLDLSIGILPVFKQLATVAALLALGLAGLGWRASGATAVLRTSDALFILYFLALGVGFMLVEIPLAQKLILPLGYPTLALTVILFSILLGGGAGSWFSQRFEGDALRRWAVGCALGVAIATSGSVFLLHWLHDALLMLSLPLRCLVTAILLLPMGFLLGTPFPAGLRLFARDRADHVPLIWGLNGVASVVGSLCAAMGAKLWGFDTVLTLGALVYVGAALLLAGKKQ